MTEKHPDRAEVALREALEQHAADAPPPGDLLEQVRQRRWKRWRTAGPVVLATAAVVAVLVVVGLPGSMPGGVPQPAKSDQAAGWRWESYGGIEVRVPADWTYGTTGSPPCLVEEKGKPYIGRPGFVRAIRCAIAVPELDKRTPYLWFGTDATKPGVREHDHGWVEETRDLHGVRITVLADNAALRERILDSARPIGDADAYGCAPSHPNSVSPEARPKPGAGLEAVGTVEEISVCTYAIDKRSDARLPLIGGSALFGEGAQTAVDTILAAPRGSGPNEPTSCLADYSYGDQITVLLVRGDQGTAEVVVRYGGCDHHGTDDGQVERQLTREVAQRVLTGPHKPGLVDGSVVDLIWGPQPDK